MSSRLESLFQALRLSMSSPPRSAVERAQQEARRAFRNYEILARGEGDTLLEMLAVRDLNQKERDLLAARWARASAEAYAKARRLAGVEDNDTPSTKVP